MKRWSETTDVINDILQREGADRATLEGILRCMNTKSRRQLSADLDAISLLYPALIIDETKPLISILIRLTAICIDYNVKLAESISRSIAIVGENSILDAWNESVWRMGPAEE